MLYAVDTEFMDDGRTIELLSLALVAEDGRELYLENWNAHTTLANDWVREHVFPHLHLAQQPCPDDGHDCPLTALSMMGRRIVQWLNDPVPTFLGYYAAYDWVALCQLFGAMMALPKDWPMYCRDLRQWLDDNGGRGITRPDAMAHHALSDARWIMWTWQQRYRLLADNYQREGRG